MIKKYAPHVAALFACALSACGVSHGDECGYVVNNPLITVNAATQQGYYSHAEQLAARVYPGVFIQGPQGEQVANSDFATAEYGYDGENPVVIYTITAQYSDYQPVTCVDFLASFVLGYQPLTQEIDRIECPEPTSTFRVYFKPNTGQRWQYLFGPGTIMPAHILAQKANLDLPGLLAILNDDQADHSSLITLWNSIFNLDNFKEEDYPSYGPYRISNISEHNSARVVTLVRNDNYQGDSAVISPIIMYSQEAAPTRAGDIFAVDTDSSIDWLNQARSQYFVSTTSHALTEQLIFNQGLFDSIDNRRALAGCIDADSVAQASASVSGVEVPVVSTRVSPIDSSVAASISRPVYPTYALGDIRIAFYGDDQRMRAMIEAMDASCSSAGTHFIITDNQDLSQADIILAAVDSERQFPNMGNLDLMHLATLRAEEQRLWEELPTIPLAAQPRTFAFLRGFNNFSVNASSTGLGWNMDRWQED